MVRHKKAEGVTFKLVRNYTKRGVAVFVFMVVTAGLTFFVWDSKVNAIIPPDSCFAFSSGTITDYYDNENDDSEQPACPKNVDIPNEIGGVTVTVIGSNAFTSKQLTAVTMPDTITTINNAAFAGNQLVSLYIPNSVTNIGQVILSGNPITSLTIGTSDFSGTPVLQLQPWTFGLTGLLSSVNIGNNVVYIGSGTFSNNQLTSIIIPNSVTLVGSGMVSGNPIESVTIGTADFTGTPSTVIDYGAFSSAHTIENVSLGNNVLTINAGAFQNNSISSVTIPASVQTVGWAAFMGNPLETVTVNGNPTIGPNSFAYNLDQSTIPSGLSDEEEAQYYQDHADYVRLYSSNTDFISTYGSGGHVHTETYDDNTYIVGGFIVNPATYTVNYRSITDEVLAPSFTSGVSSTLPNYSIAVNPIGDFSLYYRSGNAITLNAPIVEGYTTPASHNLILAAGANQYTFSYEPLALEDNSNNVPTAPSTGLDSINAFNNYFAWILVCLLSLSLVLLSLNRLKVKFK